MGDVDELQSFIVNGIDVIIGEGLLWLGDRRDRHADRLAASPASSLAPLLAGLRAAAHLQPADQADLQGRARARRRRLDAPAGKPLRRRRHQDLRPRESRRPSASEEATEAYYDQQIRAINARSLFFPFSRAVGFFSNVFMIGVGGYFDPAPAAGVHPRRAARVPRLLVAAVRADPDAGARQRHGPARRGRGGACSKCSMRPTNCPMRRTRSPLDRRARRRWSCGNVTFRLSHGARAGREPVRVRPAGSSSTSRSAPGKTVALCGPSGSGKSTILNLLLRFYDPTARPGHCSTAATCRAITRDSLRSHFALVQQETFLFNDCILDNIRYGHAEATMEQVDRRRQGRQRPRLHRALPDGYDTKVGERGVRLSGGQKQRISIARAFLANPDVLLLDEPTSSVEPDCEAAIIAALDRLMAGRTTVLTSHRPSLINQADVVYVIEDGRVTEQGSPAELERNGGWFARFMRSAEEAMPVMK